MSRKSGPGSGARAREALTGEARWELTPLQEAVINLRDSRDPPLAFADIGEQLAMNAKQVGPLLKESQQ